MSFKALGVLGRKGPPLRAVHIVNKQICDLFSLKTGFTLRTVRLPVTEEGTDAGGAARENLLGLDAVDDF